MEIIKDVLRQPPRSWSRREVVKWLHIIGLDQYSQIFIHHGIDGYLVLDLTVDDLENELKIKSKIHRKKIINAIEDLRQLDTKMTSSPNKNTKRNPDSQTTNKSPRSINRVMQIGDDHSVTLSYSNIHRPRIDHPLPVDIICLEGEVKIEPNIVDLPITIGSHPDNTILVKNKLVSYFHTVIVNLNGKFVLRDNGSTTGTFVKVEEPLELEQRMVIEIGSQQFIVSKIFVDERTLRRESQDSLYKMKTDFVELSFFGSRSSHNKMRIYDDTTIGKNIDNSLPFPTDYNMSDYHCRIIQVGHKFFLEDLVSTNGVWVRLTKDSITYFPFYVSKPVTFKVGTSTIFRAVIAKEMDSPIIGIRSFIPVE